MSVSVSTSVRHPTRPILYRETRRARLGCLGVGLTSVLEQERLVGRDVVARVGMTVKLTEQALERRAENGRSDPSKGGTGTVVKCHPNWTCDVMWHNTKRVRVGYACGTAAGKVRAFHLAMVKDELGEQPATEWNRCKTGVIPSRAPYV